MQLKGYRRPDGRVGFRNHLLILPTNICSSGLAQKISQKVPGAIAITDNSGCCILDKDQEIHARTIINTAGNPNVGATLVVGLGCEALSAERAASEIEKFGKPVRHLSIQQVGGTVKTRQLAVQMAKEMMSGISILRREPVPIADLSVGLECGGSDPASGLTANPALGVAVDRIVDEGGTAVLSETDECIGAEVLMARNAKNKAVGKRIIEVVKRYEKHVKMFGTDLSTGQPTRGNIEAGLSTIEEKSLGCIMKLGTRPIVEVLEYAAIPSQKGPILMDTPGFDATSMTGLVAGGCQVIVFTTGRGTPLGTAITPVIKVISNTPAYERMRDNIDINAGSILEGAETIAEVGERIYEMILQVCNGRRPRAEILKEGQFAVWQTTALL
jgi:altronate dehydratase large subunit